MEKSILWKLPLTRVLQYYHCALRAEGLWTVPPASVDAAAVKDEAAEVHALALELPPEVEDVEGC